jgi:TP901 family phage tail tape measure protein
VALGAYDIRFILSISDRTRSGMQRIVNDTRKLSKADKELAASQKYLNSEMREAVATQRAYEAQLAKTQAQEVRLRQQHQAAIKARRRGEQAIVSQKRSLKLLSAQLADLNANELRYNKMLGAARDPERKKYLNYKLDAIRIRKEQIGLDDANHRGLIKQAEGDMRRLISQQMSLLSQIRYNKELQMQWNAAIAQSVTWQAALTKELAAQERVQALRDKRESRMRKGTLAVDAGRNMMLRGLLLTAGSGFLAQQAATFDTGAMKAATQVAKGPGARTPEGMTRSSAKLQEEILGMMGQFPARAQEMEDAAYQIFSAMNVTFGQGVDLLRTFNAVAVAGATDLATATNAGITLFNNFGGSAQQNAKALDTAFAVIRLGRMEFDDFNDMLNQVVPVAKATGQSLEDVGGAMAFVTSRIPSQRQSATAIARLLEVLSRSDARLGLKKLGASIEDEKGNLLSLPKIMEQIVKLPLAQTQSGINELIPFVTSTGRGEGRGIQSTIQARKALSLLINQFKEYQEIQKQVAAGGDEFRIRYEMMLGTAGVKWERFKSQLQAIAIVIGQGVLPFMLRLADLVSRGVDWAKANSGTVKLVASMVALFGVANLVLGVLASFAGSVVVLYNAFRLMAGAGGLGAVLGRLGALGQVLGVLARIASKGIIIGITLEILTSFDGQRAKLGKWLDEKVIDIIDFPMLPGGVKDLLKRPFEADLDMRNKMLKEIKQKKDKELVKKANDPNEIAKILKNIPDLAEQIYSDKLTRKQLEALGLSPAQLQKHYNGPEGQQRRKQIAQQITNETKNIRDQVISNLSNIRSQFQQENETAFGALFQGPHMTSDRYKWFEQFGVGPTMDDMLKDLRMQRVQFTKYRASLATLTRKGLPPELLNSLKAMGQDGVQYIEILTKATPKQLREYIAEWKRRGKEIEKATDIDFKNKLNSWEKFGKDMAFQIAAGFASEDQNTVTKISGMVDSMYGALIAKMAAKNTELQNAAAGAAVAITNPFGGVQPTTTTTRTGPLSGVALQTVYPSASYLTSAGGFGNPGVLPRYLPNPLPRDGRKGGRNNPMPDRTLNSTGDTYNIQVQGIMSPVEAFDAAARKSAFRRHRRNV